MLAQIRSFAKSTWASGLLGLLVVSFAVWAIRDVFRAPNLKDSVVKAGDRNVTSPKFKKFYDNYKKQLEQQQNGGQPIANADALAAGVDTQLASELAYEESLNELIRREGVRPSDQLVAKQLATARSFINPVSAPSTATPTWPIWLRTASRRRMWKASCGMSWPPTISPRA